MTKKFKNISEKTGYYAEEHEKHRKELGLSTTQYYQISAHRNCSGSTVADRYEEVIHKKVRNKRKMNQYQLFKIETWEQAKPKEFEFTHVYYTKKSGEVRKVKGTVTVMKSALVNGERKMIPGTKKVRWDGYGRCYVGTHNQRKRTFDIPLNL